MHVINACKRTFLFVGAHPDDVEINAGGTMSKLVREGHRVAVVVLTHQSESPRAIECKRALACLGVTETYFPGAADSTVECGMAHWIGRLDAIICHVEPDTLVTHFHADTHQDHVACYRVAVAAGRKVQNFMMFKPTYPSGRPDIPFHPTVVSLLTQEDVTAKENALNAYESQRTKYGDDQWTSAMTAVAQGDAWTYGGVHGHAELFQLGRLVI